MTFTLKEWQNGSSGGTPISAAALKDLEERLGAYADLQATQIIQFGRSGGLFTTTGAGRFVLPYNVTLISAVASVGAAPTGAAIIVDVNLNGTTIFSTQANRPKIEPAANISQTATPNTTSAESGKYLTVDIDQIGSTIAGSDLVVEVLYRRA